MAVVTLAGQNGSPGFTDGTGTGAQFDLPSGLASDGTDVWVCDTNNDALRRVTPAGIVTTIYSGSNLNGPEDVAVDDNDVAFVAAVGGDPRRIVRVTAAGSTSSLWTVSATFGTFLGVGVNPDGDLILTSVYRNSTTGVRLDEFDHPYTTDLSYTYPDTTEDVSAITWWNGYWWALRRDQNGHTTQLHRFTPGSITAGPTRVDVSFTGANYLAPNGADGLLITSSSKVTSLTLNAPLDAVASQTDVLSSSAYGVLLGPARITAGIAVASFDDYLILIEADVVTGRWRVGSIGFPS
jgi:hypothetical protein